jgi:hypothetical protein
VMTCHFGEVAPAWKYGGPRRSHGGDVVLG